MAQAFVQDIQQKETSAGKMYDFIFSDGNKVGAGKFPPKGIAVGDYVKYDVTMRGQYMNLTPGSMSKLAPPAGVAAPAPAPARAASNSAGYDKRQEIISKQSALNSSLALVNAAIAADVLPIPKTGKADKKMDLLEEIVYRYAAKFYHIATGENYDMPDVGVADSDLGAQEAADGAWDE